MISGLAAKSMRNPKISLRIYTSQEREVHEILQQEKKEINEKKVDVKVIKKDTSGAGELLNKLKGDVLNIKKNGIPLENGGGNTQHFTMLYVGKDEEGAMKGVLKKRNVEDKVQVIAMVDGELAKHQELIESIGHCWSWKLLCSNIDMGGYESSQLMAKLKKEAEEENMKKKKREHGVRTTPEKIYATGKREKKKD